MGIIVYRTTVEKVYLSDAELSDLLETLGLDTDPVVPITHEQLAEYLQDTDPDELMEGASITSETFSVTAQ